MNRRDVLLGAVGLGLAALATTGVIACEDDGAAPPDRGKILTDLSAVVIVPMYADASTDAKALETALASLRDAPTVESLAGARAAWKKARSSWKVTGAFLFGPADDLALTGGVIDTTPDTAKIEGVIAATTPLDANAVRQLGANHRGFGGVEVLLFDPAKDDAAVLAAFQPAGGRRGVFAALVGADLRSKIDAVRAAWAEAPTDYGKQLAQAGRGSAAYPAERQGVDAVVNGLIAAAEILVATRLAKPLGLDKTPAVPAPELVESSRSDASVDDILAVLEGIDMVYLGHRGDVKGLPLADAVAERNPKADAHLRDVLQKANEAIRAISGPLRTAVVERRDPVIAAHAAVHEVKRSLMAEIAGALGTSVGFGVTDGD